MGNFNDGYTKMLKDKMEDWGLDKIYEMEDNLQSQEKNGKEIVDYLKDVCCSMPLGLALRRYLCGKFGKELVFKLADGTVRTVGDYKRQGYDIVTEDVEAYVDIFLDLNEKWCPEKMFTKAEARRLIRMTGICTRSKVFELSFALHMNDEDVHKFLTDVLAEQSYNYRNPDEIIAYFCHTHDDINTYADYCRIKAAYEELLKTAEIPEKTVENYTRYAKQVITQGIQTEEVLLNFLVVNTANFRGYSETAYQEFIGLFEKAMKKTKVQSFSNDEYLSYERAETREDLKRRVERINRSVELQEVTNTEQLAKAMLRCIPRATTVRVQNGKEIISNDFIPIYNGENGQKSNKVQTTTLPKEITRNLLMKDRLDDLIRRIKPVERKDLVFLKFYIFSLDLDEKDEYLAEDCQVFMDECNSMLERCGMSRLYPANRFENLVLLSLFAEQPFSMFELIIDNSFVNEPPYETE